jgi:predicted AlkP superfamily phosphohydrolase/phosphomutase
MSPASDRGAAGRELPLPLRLLLVAVWFSLAVGAWLGVAGLTTSVFSLTLSPAQALPVLAAAALVFAVVEAALVGTALLLRRRRERLERLAVHGAATVTLWVALVLAFLPLKGSESFVRAGKLSTLELNALGLAAILVVGWAAGWLFARLVGLPLALMRRRLSATGMGAVAVILAALAVATLWIGSSARIRSLSSMEGAGGAVSTPRVAIIGVDGCDWEKLGPLVEAGRLPVFQDLMDRGCYGPLRSIPPLVSPRIWTSIATGKVAEKHGIHDFVNAEGVPVNSAMRTATPVWDVVSAHGRPVGVVGWYVTWPANEVNGFLLSDRLHSLLRGPVQIAQTLSGRPTNERLESFGTFEFDPAYKAHQQSELSYQQNRIVDEPLRWGYLRDAIYTKFSDVLLPAYRPSLSAVYLRGVDFVQHFFWQYADPEPFGGVAEDDAASYGPVIDNYYVYTDRLLGRLLKALGEDVNVLIVADHGFQARLDVDPGRPQLTGAHDVDGVFIAAGPAIDRRGRTEGATILDIAPTALALMGLPVAEDMDGRVLEEIVRPEHLIAHPVSTTATYEPAGGSVTGGDVGSTMDESIREQLRSLGYIE